MKKLFIEAKYTKPIKLTKEVVEKLPNKIGLVSSIQFIDSLESIKKQLKDSVIAGQILGCNAKPAEKTESKVNAFLYVGDGSFHPLAVALATKKPVFTFNPLNNNFSKIKEQDIESYKKRKKGALLKFLSAENIGILVSTKPGQYYDIKKLEKLEKKYLNKKFYTFMAETVDYAQLENFPFIGAWVNTACPRIEEDIKIINIKDIS
ncbi:MAG: diphthamide synthesis protein [Nanoarchaeota archaeon]|nr:diphthamide synthesis protein [Nanoarchaeota archaeon]